MNIDKDVYDMLSKRPLLTRSSAGKDKFLCPHCGKNDFEINPDDGSYQCWSGGCTPKDIRAAIDKLEGKPEWKPRSKTIDRPTKTIRARSRVDYFYPDRNGNDLIRVRRDDDGDGKKKFTQAHWNGNEWEYSNPDEIRKQIPIYRYTEVRQAIADDKLVFIVEGESAADALWDIGIPATTTIGGAGKFAKYGDYATDFDGGVFVLAPDCDAIGVKHTAEIAAFLGDKVQGHYLAGSNPDLWVDPAGGFDIKDDITDRGVDKDRILASVISDSEYRLALNPIKKKSAGRPRKSSDESEEKEEKKKTPARDLIIPVLENVYRDVVRYDADLDRYWHYSDGLWSCVANSFIYTLVQKYLIEIKEPYSARFVDEVIKLSRGFVRDAKWLEVDIITHIPFKNGVLEIATKNLFPHSPAYEFRWQLPREYSNSITGWDRIKLFLDEISGGNNQLKNILLAFCNKALTGRCGSPKFLYLSGSGGNGKGVFMELVESLVGKDNTKTTSLASLNDNRFEPANIRDKRVVICADEDRKPDSLTVFKSATGGDNISCEYKGKQAIDFKYEGIFIVAANKPIFQGENHEAMKRRKVDFPCLHQPPKKDEHLISKLRSELPQFTTYVLGLDPKWVSETIAQSDNVNAIAMLAREMSIQENNVAGYYYSQLIVDPESSAPTASLYKNYEAYCNENNLKPCNGNRFPKMLWELCNHSLKIAIGDKRIANVRHFTGIRIATPMDVIPDADLMPTSADLSAGSEPLLRKAYADLAGLSSEKLINVNLINKLIEGEREELINLYSSVTEKIELTQQGRQNNTHNQYNETVSADFTNTNEVGINQQEVGISQRNPEPTLLSPCDRVWIAKYNENGTVEQVWRSDTPKPHTARVVRDSGKPMLLNIIEGEYRLIAKSE